MYNIYDKLDIWGRGGGGGQVVTVLAEFFQYGIFEVDSVSQNVDRPN